MKTRNAGYDRGILRTHRVNCPVISVGNITMGGTGKTPLTEFILEQLKAKAVNVAVVSRAYKAETIEPRRVDIKVAEASRIFGDEAVLIAKRHPEVQVYVGQNKTKIAEFAFRDCSPDVIVVDDGFQHRRLARDLNIVLLDVTEPLDNYKVFPAGRARESLAGLKRADLIVLTKINLVDEEKISDLQKIIPMDKACVCVGYKQGPVILKSELVETSFQPEKDDLVILFCGIAKPHIFYKMFQMNFPQLKIHLIPFPDHHPYDDKDIELIRKRAKTEGFAAKKIWFVTTQKDLVKLGVKWPSEFQLFVVDLILTFETGQEQLQIKLDEVIRKDFKK